MSSLITLLEAARYVELQEQQQQHIATVEAALATIKPLSTTAPSAPQPHTITLSSSQTKQPISSSGNAPAPTVVISSNLLQLNPAHKKDVPPTTAPSRGRVLHNSFDIINPLIIDETSGETKRKQPPLVFRSGTREVHNKLEKHRRAHLKECFDILKKHLPPQQDEKKTSNLSILHSALKYIQTLKRKERELEHEMERLARDKISAQQRLAILKKDIVTHYDNVDFAKVLPEGATVVENGTNSEPEEQETVLPTKSPMKRGSPVLAKAPPQKELGSLAPTTNNATPLVLPMSYPVNQGLVLQKVALLPTKGLSDLAPLVSTHFITTPQQINGKVVPLAQYLVKPVVVVSTASPRPS